MTQTFQEKVMASYKKNYTQQGWEVVKEGKDEIKFQREDEVRHYQVDQALYEKIAAVCPEGISFSTFSHADEIFIIKSIALEDEEDGFDLFFRLIPEDEEAIFMLEKLYVRGTGTHEVAEKFFEILKEHCLNDWFIQGVLKKGNYEIEECKDY